MIRGAEPSTIDGVIMPQATRSRVACALAMLCGKTVEMSGSAVGRISAA